MANEVYSVASGAISTIIVYGGIAYELWDVVIYVFVGGVLWLFGRELGSLWGKMLLGCEIRKSNYRV